MDRIPRRRILSLVGALGLGGVATQRERLEQFSPFSGDVWAAADRNDRTIATEYGDSTVSYDEFGVPHIEADHEAALYFATGFVQARDRLFQMDLVRRNMAGELAAVFGKRAVEIDRFHVKMDFIRAAEASWSVLQDTAVADPLRAFSDGVNRFIDEVDHLPIEFALLDYHPGRWSPVASLLVSKQIAWELTGTFWDLKRAVIADALGQTAVAELYPPAFDHAYPVIRPSIHGKVAPGASRRPPVATEGARMPGKPLVDWLSAVAGGRRRAVGSNNWVVSGRHTASGSPILANDPHLSLSVPPVWYELHQRSARHDVRGVAFPGVPFVVIGQNRHVAWGFTNVGADVIDFYTYETRNDGRDYLLDDRWRPIDESTRPIDVATDDGPDTRDITVRKTVHGPLIEREGHRVGVAWVGLSATREPLAIYRYNHATDIDEFRHGLEVFDIPGQNTVYIDADGNTMYSPAAKYPIRRIDGDPVAGNRIFDGSAREGEWVGFTPYGESTWAGFIPFEELPHVINPGYVASANQRVVDGYEYYLADSQQMGDPYRARAIYRQLDQWISADRAIDVGDMRQLQNDRRSRHAAGFVPQILAATDRMNDRARRYAETLIDWEYGMRADSEAALVYAVWQEHYRDVVYGPTFARAGLDETYYPAEDWPLQHLDPNSHWFDDAGADGHGTRADAIAEAMERAVETIRAEGFETYGDYHRLSITHPFGLDFLDYPALPADGSGQTIFNIGAAGDVGSSWRMLASFDEPSYSIIPGGNSGDYFSSHYADQLDRWLAGEYKRMSLDVTGEPTLRFEGTE